MNKKHTRYACLEDDSKIIGIGSLFRYFDSKQWRINLEFEEKSKDSLRVGAMPILARKRVLNPTSQKRNLGKPLKLTIDNAQQWDRDLASECAAYKKSPHGEDSKTWCFVVNEGNTKVYIPQQELARAVFYHDSYMTRLSLQHNTLSEDFMVERENKDKTTIHVREGTEYPNYFYRQESSRRFLSWVILDTDARKSFESISKTLLKNTKKTEKYQTWNFEFTPPQLKGVKLEVRGWHDFESNSFFVWEITAVRDLPSDISGEVDFINPKDRRRVGGKPTKADGKPIQTIENHELDDEELSDVDKATIALMSKEVITTFKNPHITNRKSDRTVVTGVILGEREEEVVDKKSLSVNGSEEGRHLSSGAWNNLDDQSDDAHLYLNKFESFKKMISVLVESYGYHQKEIDIIKLPNSGRREKHLLDKTGDPRCLLMVELTHGQQSFTLLELDTSDGAKSLSTVCLKNSGLQWAQTSLDKVALGLMKNSLAWPNELLKDKFGADRYITIGHPTCKSGSLPFEELSPWALRAAIRMGVSEKVIKKIQSAPESQVIE